MTAVATTRDTIDTLRDLLERLGDISPDRIRFRPPPGSATEADVIQVERDENLLCELVDGVLVEKGIGYRESLLAIAIARALGDFVLARNLGLVTGADGMIGLFPGLVRIPDVAYVSWDRVPGRKVPAEAIPHFAPNIAVEVLSSSNTAGEMARKRREYFRAGVELLWVVDPNARTLEVFSDPDRSTLLGASQSLDGGTVLPGFVLSLGALFAELDRHGD